MPEDDFELCDQCGAIVYPEHLDAGKAASVNGKLMCPHCLTEYNATHHSDAPRAVGQTTMRAPGEADNLEAIAIDDSSPMSMSSASLRAMGVDASQEMVAHHDDSTFQRPLLTDGQAATRCRTFHSRLNDGAIVFMNRQINEWVDANPDISIKFAASTVGVFEGKKAEQCLIVTVFY